MNEPNQRLRDLGKPELAIFDVDGTLHDTFRWWTKVFSRGIRSFGEEQGLDLPVPDQPTLESVVGNKDAGVWQPLLPDEHKGLWEALRAHVIPMEVAEISSGIDYLFPGVRELLVHLRANGVQCALASNCRAGYFQGVKEGQGLGTLVDSAWCLDSEGVETKTDMLRQAMAAAGTERAVMVGDRDADQNAALEAGLPFIWRHNDKFPMADMDGTWDGSVAGFCRLVGVAA